VRTSRYNADMTSIKPRPNHAVYLRALQAMSPQARLRKAFELSAFALALFRAGLARRFPDMSAGELDRLMRDRLERCHNRNY
jgi:Xaa-Pro aminopeptidase